MKMAGTKDTSSRDELLALFQEAFSKTQQFETLGTPDVCKVLGKSRWTVYKLVEEGKLTAYQSETGKKGSSLVFKKEDVFKYLDSTLKHIQPIKKDG